VFDNYSQFEQIPENVESVVLCQPEILFDWSRNSGPVVSSQTLFLLSVCALGLPIRRWGRRMNAFPYLQFCSNWRRMNAFPYYLQLCFPCIVR
jgi:hypothetical protein